VVDELKANDQKLVEKPTEDEWDKERAKATILHLRDLEKEYKSQLVEMKTKIIDLETKETAKLTDAEKAAKKLADLEATLNNQKSEYEAKLADAEAKRLEAETETASQKRSLKVAKVAAELGAYDPHDANILSASAEIDIADSKAEEKIKSTLELLKKNKPYLFKAGRGLEPFNPSGGGGAETDRQRVQRLQKVSTQSIGPLS